MDTEQVALASVTFSGLSVMVSSVAVLYTKRQTRTATAALLLAKRIDEQRGSLKSVRLEWDPKQGRVVAGIASGDSAATIEGLDVDVLVRRPVQRALGLFWVWGFHDLLLHISRNEAWLFFESDIEDFPHRLEPHSLLRLGMTPLRVSYEIRQKCALEIALGASTSSGGYARSAPYTLGDGERFDRTPARYEGKGGNWHQIPFTQVIEMLGAIVSPDVVRVLLQAVANTQGLCMLAEALDRHFEALTSDQIYLVDYLIRPERVNGDSAVAQEEGVARETAIEEILLKVGALVSLTPNGH